MTDTTPTNFSSEPLICRACAKFDALLANKGFQMKFMAVIYGIMFIVVTWGVGVIVLNLLGVLPIY